MALVEAVYQGGVFKPLKEVRLAENQRVLLNVQVPGSQDVGAWLAEVTQFQEKIVAERGYFPDSAADIATDRVRDE
jgi:predicted DNA-binding antitoxin AbrB/MazE fold protein